MKKTTLDWIIAPSLAILFLLAGSTMAFGQEGEAEEVVDLEVFEILSFSDGLHKSMQQGRDSINLKVTLNADTMGKLPDDNAAEALSRLGSIFMSDDAGEGRYIAIRGVAATLNNVTMNGQAIAASDTNGQDGRAAPLDVLSAASISEIEVIKSVTPDMDLQSVGGAINIKTRSAFDGGGASYTRFTSSLNFNTQNDGQENYKAAFAHGFTFGENKEWGLFLAGNYTVNNIMFFRYRNVTPRLLGESSGFSDYISADGIDNEFGDILLFERFSYRYSKQRRERYGVNATLEFKPNEDFHAWLRFYLTRSNDDMERWTQDYRPLRDIRNDQRARVISPRSGFSQRARITGVWSDHHQERPVHQFVLGGEKKFGNFTIETNVVFTNAKETRANDFRLEVEERADNRNIDAFKKNPTLENSAASGFEAASGFSTFVLTQNAQFVRDTIAEDDDEDLRRAWEYIAGDVGDLGPEDFNLQNIGFYTLNEQQFNPTFVEEDTFTANVDVHWNTQIGGRNATFSGGFKYLTREKFVEKESIRQDPVRDHYMFMDGTGNTITGNLTRSFESVFGSERFPYPGMPADVQLWLPDREKMRAEQNAQNASDDSAFEDDPDESIKNSVEDDYFLTEDITAFYFMATVRLTDNFTLLGGARYEKTEAAITNTLVSEVLGPLPVRILPGIVTPVVYENFTPNVHFRWDVADNWVVRGAYTGTIGRPDYVDLGSPGDSQFEIDVEDDGGTPDDYTDDSNFEGEAALPNPNLQPFESTNIDFSVAHYFKDGTGYFSVGGFYKKIDNPIYDFTEIEFDVPMDSLVERFNLEADHVYVGQGILLEELEIDTVINGEPEKVWGYEFEFQKRFDNIFPGFGVVANYTILDSKVTVPSRPTETLRIEDQAEETWNLQLYYEKKGFDVRLAFRHQGLAFDNLASHVNRGQFEDRRIEPRNWIDLFVSYYITPKIKISFSARNLTDESKEMYIIDPAGDRRLDRIERYGTTYEVSFNWSL